MSSSPWAYAQRPPPPTTTQINSTSSCPSSLEVLESTGERGDGIKSGVLRGYVQTHQKRAVGERKLEEAVSRPERGGASGRCRTEEGGHRCYYILKWERGEEGQVSASDLLKRTKRMKRLEECPIYREQPENSRNPDHSLETVATANC